MMSTDQKALDTHSSMKPLSKNTLENYLMVLPVQFYRVDEHTVACESAFAEHLKQLRDTSAKAYRKVVVAAPHMSDAYYQENAQHLGHINEQEERIEYVDTHEACIGVLKFWLRWSLPAFFKIFQQVKRASMVHAGPSKPVFIPLEFLAILLGVISRRRTAFFVDIDERESAYMAYVTGRLSKKSYFLCKYLYDPLFNAQIAFGARFCRLALLKGASLVRDFGRGRPQVKNFLDTAYSADVVLQENEVLAKQSRLQAGQPLELVYFGRLTAYKGIDHMIRAVVDAKRKYKANVKLSIIGNGGQDQELRALMQSLQAEDCVQFLGAFPYGRELFDVLEDKHLLLAAPLAQDTPRSVFDAMALGIPTLGYDTYYYKDLESTGAVDTVKWLSEDAMAKRITEYAEKPELLKPMIEKAVAFARENTQDAWLQKREAWMQEFL